MLKFFVRILFCIILTFISAIAFAKNFYVATTGSDSNPGTFELPFLTIQAAANLSELQAGDVVIIRSGIYRVSGDHALVISRSGSSAGGYITFKSEVPLGAKIIATSGYDIIYISANYIEMSGLDVSGEVEGHCIESYNAHHIRIIGNNLHDCGGSGFQGNAGDYWFVEGNRVTGNSHTNRFATSGISLYQARAISDDIPIIHNVVRNNITYNNIELTSGAHTDGNGIIIDDFHNGQNGSAAGNYPFKTLVENNLSYFNGGKGIQVYVSDHVILRNNTVYWNNRDLLNKGTWRGEINLQNASDVKVINNIACTNGLFNANNTAILQEGGQNNIWLNNLTYNGHQGKASVHGNILGNKNKFGINPQFVAPNTSASANFQLQSNSPAINAGTSLYDLSAIDLALTPRVKGDEVDIGAYEFDVLSTSRK